MAHFALVKNNLVENIYLVSNAVMTDSDGVEDEKLGKKFLSNLHGHKQSELVQCSYNGTIRGVYPGVGFGYDPDQDIFFESISAPEVTDAGAEDSGQ